jgi:hypothetical protein
MPKPLGTHWFLQQIADTLVKELAPGRLIIPSVQHKDDQIVWDEDCKGVGRTPWFCRYILSPDDPSAESLVPTLNAAMAHYQELYDLGLTCG